MKIYYYGIFDGFGGIENYAKNLIFKVTQTRPDIRYVILSIFDHISYEKEFLSYGCDIVKLPNPYKHPIKFKKSLLDIFKKANPREDLIQLNICSYRNLELFTACRDSGLHTIVVAHASGIKNTGARAALSYIHYLNRFIFHKLGCNVAVSQTAGKFMFGNLSNVKIIENGINSEIYSFSKDSREMIRTKFGVGDNVLLLGQIGRISKEKNQLFSIHLLEALRNKGINCKLILAGKNGWPDPSNYALDHNLSQYVSFIGVINNPWDLYSGLDVALLPSISEGLSLALLEMCSNGVYSLVSSGVPKIDITSSNVNYLDLDVNSWSNFITSNLMHIKNNQRKNIIYGTKYDLKAFAEEYIKLYDSLTK